MAENPRTAVMMVALAAAFSLGRRDIAAEAREAETKGSAFDPYERAEKIREERERRMNRY